MTKQTCIHQRELASVYDEGTGPVARFICGKGELVAEPDHSELVPRAYPTYVQRPEVVRICLCPEEQDVCSGHFFLKK